jgi:hypothetical protein
MKHDKHSNEYYERLRMVGETLEETKARVGALREKRLDKRLQKTIIKL